MELIELTVKEFAALTASDAPAPGGGSISALCGALFLHETMSARELTGCIIMFIAFIIAQIPEMRSDE